MKNLRLAISFSVLLILLAVACQSGGCSAIKIPPVTLTGSASVDIPDIEVPPVSLGAEDPEPAPCSWVPSEKASRGTSPPSIRIVGGELSPPRAFPWAVALETPRGWQYCAGTVVGPRRVVTAAHCQVTPGDIVHAGTDTLEIRGQTVSVKETRNHPEWKSVTSGNDAAVLVLEEDLTVPAISLAKTTPTAGLAMAIGWGSTCFGCDTTPDQRYVTVPILTNSECVQAYGASIDETMLCAGEAGKDSCQGDSGGPLVFNSELVGIVSWGERCAEPGWPGVYTDVAKMKEWFEACSE